MLAASLPHDLYQERRRRSLNLPEASRRLWLRLGIGFVLGLASSWEWLRLGIGPEPDRAANPGDGLGLHLISQSIEVP